MTTFYERFKELCKQNGVTQSHVMEEIGYTRGAASIWSKGRTPNSTSVKKVADYFGVSPSYFYDEEEQIKKEPLTSQALGALVMMPVIGTVRAGMGTAAEEIFTGEYIGIPIDALHNNPQDYRCLAVKGDSMYPFFQEGLDKLVVDIADCDPANGSYIIAILGNGDGVLKKLHINDDGSRDLISINPMYPPIHMREGDRIYGKVVRCERIL